MFQFLILIHYLTGAFTVRTIFDGNLLGSAQGFLGVLGWSEEALSRVEAFSRGAVIIIGIWVGKDDNTTVENLSGGNQAAKLYREIIKHLL